MSSPYDGLFLFFMLTVSVLLPYYGSKDLYYRTIPSLTPSPDFVYNASKIKVSTYLIALKVVDYQGHER